MSFLLKSDLYLSILNDELHEITRGDDTLVSASLSSAVAEMKVYLYDSYDTDAIFGTSGDARHQLLVNLGADMAVYFIVARCQAGIDIKDRHDRYKRAVATLKKFQESEVYADLPRKPIRAQKAISYTANRKRNNYYNN